MRESRLYLKFLKRNFLIIFLPGLFFFLISFVYQVNLPKQYGLERLYELSYEDNQAKEKMIVADEIVTILRSANFKERFLSNNADKRIEIFKPGPLAIQVQVKSQNFNNLRAGADEIEQYLKSNYKVSSVGKEIYFSPEKNSLIVFLMSFGAGCIAGLIVSLIREYVLRY